ncbi:MAG: tRNA adenosine(34) deaminase TadA [Gammaproteobacteria bacterium]|nr:tRNA adenosine(34) deaminase TadA [Gammaproteobacteria bacterium]
MDEVLERDQHWMRQALDLAAQAEAQNEVPVGALIVYQDQLVASGFNQPIAKHDCTAHAEIIVIRQACDHVKNYRLPGMTLYCTLEPCPMCAGAMVHARIQRLVYAASDPRTGAAGSIINLLNHPDLNHQVETSAGVLAEQASQQLKNFFKRRR